MGALSRLVATSTTVAATAAVIVVGPFAAPASADGFSNKECHGPSYVQRQQLVSAHRAVTLTHLEGFSMPPTSSHRVTKSTQRQTVLRAAVRLSASASASIGFKIIGKAEARLDMELRAMGEHTAKSAVKITDRIANKTRHNVTFAFYKGATKAYGRWKSSSCKSRYDRGGDYRGTYVYWRYGRWSSYEFADSGAVRCGAGTQNISPAAKQALRRVCG